MIPHRHTSLLPRPLSVYLLPTYPRMPHLLITPAHLRRILPTDLPTDLRPPADAVICAVMPIGSDSSVDCWVILATREKSWTICLRAYAWKKNDSITWSDWIITDISANTPSLPDDLPASDLTREIRRIQQILVPSPPAPATPSSVRDTVLIGFASALILIPIIIAALITLAE